MKITKMKLSVKEITMMGMMLALLEVSKLAMMGIPNIELVTFLIIMYTLFLGKRIMFVIPAFILIEGAIFGIHIWWVMYLYMWPLLALITHLSRKNEAPVFWAIISSAFGFLFGLFCAIPYVVIGTVSGGFINGLYTGFTWWIAGIPWDILHGIGNFVIMIVLYQPVKKVFGKMKTIE